MTARRLTLVGLDRIGDVAAGDDGTESCDYLPVEPVVLGCSDLAFAQRLRSR